MTSVALLVKQIQEAKQAYSIGKRILSDEQYDELEDRLRALDPNNPILEQVGARIEAGEAVKLPIPMPSLIKIKPPELSKWLAKFPASEYQISDKLDGISALWMAPQGKLYTHGANLEGRDISSFVPLIPSLIKSKYPVRGEMIMKKNSPYIGESATTTVSGVFARKDSFDPDIVKEMISLLTIY